MTAFMPDTTCMVATVCAWHDSHQACANEVIERQGEKMMLAAHSLVEAYSVLTRLPRGRRLSPSDAMRIINRSFISRGEVVSLNSEEYVEFLRRMSDQAVSGGQVYDALIVACAVKAKVGLLLTLNARHFLPLTGPNLTVATPGSG